MTTPGFHVDRLLIVDDDDGFVRDLRDAMSDAVADDGWRRNRSLASGLTSLRTFEPDVVLLSLTLAESTPAQTLKTWFSEAEFHAPVIALIENDDAAKAERALAAGARDCLVKGDRLVDLLTRLLPHIIENTRLLNTTRMLEGNIDAFIRHTGVAIVMADPESRSVVFANRRACAMYGYTCEEFLQKNLDDLRIKKTDSLDRWTASWVRTENGEGTIRELHCSKNREILYVQRKQLDLIHRGRPVTAFAVQDMSSYKQAEDEILFLQQFNTNILDNLPFGITVKTENGRLTYQNRAAREAFELTVGRTLQELARARSELGVLAEVESALAQAAAPPKEMKFEWKGRSYSVTSMTIKDPRSDSDLSVQLYHDITERERVMHELFNAQRMEAVGNLAGGIAHDFNNLLSGIMGYANLIQAIAEDDDQVVQYAGVIEETCTRASDLTKQLLQFSRRQTSVKQLFDLNSIVRYAAKLLRHSMKKELRMIQRLSSKKLDVMGDPAQVQQMIVNLVLHANESMTEGKITVSTRLATVTEGGEAHQRGISPGAYAVVAVHDTGRALDEESMRTILDPYLSNVDSGEPVGLGLSVAVAIARSHGGGIVFEIPEQEKEGTTLTTYLPIAVQDDEKPAEDPGELKSGSETILIIDDEEVIRNLMLTSLSRFGYRVLVASGGEEGLKLYEMFKSEIDLVMLDLGLPMMDGGKVYRAIRALNPTAKVILFTGTSQKGRVKELMDEGAVAWISKPISLQRLSGAMRAALDDDDT